MTQTAWTPSRTDYTTANGTHSVISDGGSNIYRIWTDGSSIFFSKSSDEGQTYSGAVTVATANGGIPLDQPLCKDFVSGRIFVFYCKNVDTPGTACATYYRYSDSEGATGTWSAEQTLDNGTTYNNTNGRFVRLCATARNNIVNVLYSSIDNGFTLVTSGMILYRSIDNGGTFSRSTPFGSINLGDPARPTCWDDGSIIYATWADDGNLGGPTGNKGGDILFVRSLDQGATWVNQADIVTSAQIDGVHGADRPTVTVSNGVVNITFMAPFGNPLASDIWTIRSTNGGVTWQTPGSKFLHPGSNGYEHPWIVAKGRYVYLAFVSHDATPPTLLVASSSDYGASFGALTTVFTYTTGGGADAPFIFNTNGLVHVYLADQAASYAVRYLRNPVWWTPPDNTRVLYTPSGTAGPPPSAAWAGSSGACTGAGSAGDGLVNATTKVTRNSTGSFRQGSWWNTLFNSADHEIGIKIATAVSGWGTFDGLTMYTRLTAPGSGSGGYGFEFFNDATTFQIMKGDFTALLDLNTSRPTIGANDIFFLQSVGSMQRFWYLPSGSSTWQLLGNVIDATTSANGNIGLDATNSQTAAITSFMGGTVVDPIVETSFDQGIQPITRPIIFKFRPGKFKAPFLDTPPPRPLTPPPTIDTIVAASISATSTFSGNVSAQKKWIASQINATSTLVGSLTRSKILSPATINATSIVTGNNTSFLITATSTVSGVLARARVLAPTTISATSTVSGGIVARRSGLSGSVAATSTFGGTLNMQRALRGTVSATSTVSSNFGRALIGNILASSNLFLHNYAIDGGGSGSGGYGEGAYGEGSYGSGGGSLNTVPGVAQGGLVFLFGEPSQPLSSVAQGGLIFLFGGGDETLPVIRAIHNGNIAATSSVTIAALPARRKITGATISATSAVSDSGGLRGGRAITGSAMAATSTFGGSIARRRPIQGGSMAATSSMSGQVRPLRTVTGTNIAATSTFAGQVVARHLLSASLAATSTFGGSVLTGRVVAPPTNMFATSGMFGFIPTRHRLSGSISATSTFSGTPKILRGISPTQISATSTLSASFGGARAFTGQVLATSMLTGGLQALRGITPSAPLGMLAFSTVSGAVPLVRRIPSDQMLATSSVSGSLFKVATGITGTVLATSTLTGSLGVGHPLSLSSIRATSTLAGNLALGRSNINAQSTVSIALSRIAERHWLYQRKTGAVQIAGQMVGSINTG